MGGILTSANVSEKKGGIVSKNIFSDEGYLEIKEAFRNVFSQNFNPGDPILDIETGEWKKFSGKIDFEMMIEKTKKHVISVAIFGHDISTRYRGIYDDFVNDWDAKQIHKDIIIEDVKKQLSSELRDAISFEIVAGDTIHVTVNN